MENTNEMSGLKGLRYAPVALGCLMAMLIAPAYAWQDARLDHKAAITGEFEGTAPTTWEHEVSDVALVDLEVKNFTRVGQTSQYTATLNNAAVVHVFKVIQKEARRHNQITPIKVEYLDKDAQPITPVWDNNTKKVGLTFKGELTTTNGVVALTIKTAFRGGAGLFMAHDARTGSNSMMYCTKDGILAPDYSNQPFSGLIAPSQNDPIDNSGYKLIGSVMPVSTIYSRFNDPLSRSNSDGCAIKDFNMDNSLFGPAVSDSALLNRNSGGGSGDYYNNNSKSVLYAALSLPAGELVTLTANSTPAPGSWSAPLTVRLTTM
ncbi:hypothetical protein RA180_21500 [Aeromonas salmonicida]|uniref:hypothetical protein n=1 Tax=Aeromonas salmonicida TaxID=645 RepID=UPI002796734C|nr:hypothetical protein [Aeromonas salmonicida]MDQ1886568.1 hypothetical protein [Aeromonas salmonicida]